MIEFVSGVFVFKCIEGLWGREAENALLYLYRKAPILASELIRPPRPRRGASKHRRGALRAESGGVSRSSLARFGFRAESYGVSGPGPGRHTRRSQPGVGDPSVRV